MKEDIRSVRFAISIWIPFIFCAFISARTLWSKLETASMGVADPAFFCFLPMTFFFVAMVVWQIHKTVKALIQRMEDIEAQQKEANYHYPRPKS